MPWLCQLYTINYQQERYLNRTNDRRLSGITHILLYILYNPIQIWLNLNYIPYKSCKKLFSCSLNYRQLRKYQQFLKASRLSLHCWQRASCSESHHIHLIQAFLQDLSSRKGMHSHVSLRSLLFSRDIYLGSRKATSSGVPLSAQLALGFHIPWRLAIDRKEARRRLDILEPLVTCLITQAFIISIRISNQACILEEPRNTFGTYRSTHDYG